MQRNETRKRLINVNQLQTTDPQQPQPPKIQPQLPKDTDCTRIKNVRDEAPHAAREAEAARDKKVQREAQDAEMQRGAQSVALQKQDMRVEAPVPSDNQISVQNTVNELPAQLSRKVNVLSTRNVYSPSPSNIMAAGADEVVKQYIVSDLIQGETNEKPALLSSASVSALPSTSIFSLHLNTFELDCFALSVDDMIQCITKMFQELKLLELLNVDVMKFKECVADILSQYHNNSYHNARHAFDVTHTVFVFFQKTRLRTLLSDLEVLAMMIACVAHDVDHPGLNNNYQIAVCSPLALRYNDKAVLENHHASRLFETLQKPDFNILANLTKADFAEVRKLIIGIILNTDMSKHSSQLTKFNKLIPFVDPLNKEDRSLLAKVMVHAADVSNPTKPFFLAERWTRLAHTEFLEQGDREREKKIDISPFFDRQNSNQEQMISSFIDIIVGPLFVSITKAFPELDVLVRNLHSNRAQFLSQATTPPTAAVPTSPSPSAPLSPCAPPSASLSPPSLQSNK